MLLFCSQTTCWTVLTWSKGCLRVITFKVGSGRKQSTVLPRISHANVTASPPRPPSICLLLFQKAWVTCTFLYDLLCQLLTNPRLNASFTFPLNTQLLLGFNSDLFNENTTWVSIS